MRSCRTSGLVAFVALIAAGCGGAPEAGSPGTTAAAEPEPSKPAVTVKTADVPQDDCGWISVADVEAAVGPLVEPPRKADGCLYVMTIPPEIAAKRQEHADRIAAAPGRGSRRLFVSMSSADAAR